MFRFSRHRRLVIVSAVGVLVSAAAAFAYWTSTGSGTGSSAAGHVDAVTIIQSGTLNPMYPGDIAQTIHGTITNPNPGPVYVGTITVSVSSVDKAANVVGTCAASDFTLANATATVNAEALGRRHDDVVRADDQVQQQGHEPGRVQGRDGEPGVRRLVVAVPGGRATAVAVLLCSLLLVGRTDPAGAYWRAAGAGVGVGTVVGMPTGATPTVSVSGRAVTVTWTQSTVLGSRLGTYALGGYLVRRGAEGAAATTVPATACDGTQTGSAATATCTETGLLPGRWQYAVTPVLGSFTGTAGAASTAVAVLPDVPALAAPVASQPSAGLATGNVGLSWSTVDGATSYELFRRASGGAFDLSAPLATVTATSHTDPGAGLAAGTTYDYAVRAVGNGQRSGLSTVRSVTPVTRPSAPASAPTVLAGAGGTITLGWPAVPGAAGYNAYRRTASGSYGSSALNGTTPLTGTSYVDGTGVDGTSYAYVVRAVDASGLESFSSAESATVAADATAPPAPTSVTTSSGGGVVPTNPCGLTAGSRRVRTTVGTTTSLTGVESGEVVLLSATTPGASTPVTATVSASASTSATLDLSSLPDGTVTLTARTRDAVGNSSATTSLAAGALVKDTVAPSLSAAYQDNPVTTDRMLTTAECGASVTIVRTAPTAGSFGPFTVDELAGGHGRRRLPGGDLQLRDHRDGHRRQPGAGHDGRQRHALRAVEARGPG